MKFATVNFDKLTERLQTDLMEAMPDAGFSPDELRQYTATRCANSTPREVLDRWLRYQGIIGHTDAILYAIESIRHATEERPA